MPGVDFRQIEHVVDQASKVAAAGQDRREVLQLPLVQLSVRLVRQELGKSDDGVEGRAELVAHRRQELALGSARLLRGHLGAQQLPRLVQELTDVALRLRVEARVLERDEQRQADRRPQGDQHPGPRARLQAAGLGLGREHPGVDRLHQPVQILLDLLGERARRGVAQPERPLAIAPPEERVLLGDRTAVLLEGGAGRAEPHGLGLALDVLGEAPQVVGDPVRPLGPRRDVARIAQHGRPGLETHERRDGFAGGGGQAHRRDGSGRDLPVDRNQIADGVEAQNADGRENKDDEERDQEGFRGQPHVSSCPSPNCSTTSPRISRIIVLPRELSISRALPGAGPRRRLPVG